MSSLEIKGKVFLLYCFTIGGESKLSFQRHIFQDAQYLTSAVLVVAKGTCTCDCGIKHLHLSRLQFDYLLEIWVPPEAICVKHRVNF